ncbi:hypothetical protein GCM10025864_40120 [Luteimicrobium album]|uniref:Uncharacterized protein n=2 Tax=Luteimicrobium album TaxID=1054550 RepID=A0ABQ6I7X6_9MICO|nr:hypothetical protein GCM10025864_40120 [Luteimicrobium album]
MPVVSERVSRRERTAGVALLVVGIASLVGGLVWWLWPSISAFGDPLLVGVGFRGAPDGGTVVVVGPRTAAEMTTIAVHARGRATDPKDTAPPVLWRIDRVGLTPPGRDGDVELGKVPPGFVETVAPATGWRERAADVWVENACSFGSGPVPNGALRTDEVVVDGDTVMTEKEFRSDDLGFSPCLDDDSPRTDARGLALSAAGVGLLVLGPVLRRRR